MRFGARVRRLRAAHSSAEKEWIEGVLAPARDLRYSIGIALVNELEQLVDAFLQNLGRGEVVERFRNPEPLRDRIGTLVRRIENEVKPFECVLELLVLAQALGNVEWGMEEQFPVVN